MAPRRSAVTPKLNSARARTPYERPVQNRNAGATPSTPNRRGMPVSAQATPSSIFSRVKTMFTPKFLRRQEQEEPEDQDKRQSVLSEMSVDHDTTTPDKVFDFPPPVVPRPNLEQFGRSNESTPFGTPSNNNSNNDDLFSSSTTSPNQRLAEFFRNKGNQQLSDIEAEGVVSLIRQAASRNESLVEMDQDELMAAAAQGASSRRQRRSSVDSNRRTSTSPSQTFFATPNRKAREPIPVRGRYSPMTSTTPAVESGNSTMEDISNAGTPARQDTQSAQPTPDIMHFNSIPTPYRPKRYTHSWTENRSPSIEPPQRSRSSTESREESQEAEAAPEPPKEKKPLSQTASVLLSLIGDPSGQESNKIEEEEENKKRKKHEDVPEDVQDFVNPYASAPRRNTPKRSTKRLKQQPAKDAVSSEQPNTSSSSKDRVFTDLERSRPKENKKESLTPVSVSKSIDRYTHKPARSSNLRQSMVASPETSPQKSQPQAGGKRKTLDDEEEPTIGFTFKSPKANPKPKEKSSDDALYPDLGKTPSESAPAISTSSVSMQPQLNDETPEVEATSQVSPSKPLVAPTPAKHAEWQPKPFQFGLRADSQQKPDTTEKLQSEEKPPSALFGFSSFSSSSTSAVTGVGASITHDMFAFPVPPFSSQKSYPREEVDKLKNEIFHF